MLAALLLPPVPWLVLALLGARLIPWRRVVGSMLVLVSVVAMWLGACSGVGEAMVRGLISPPPPLNAERVASLKKAAAEGKPGVVVLILGGGRDARAPEYGVASLRPTSLERLRYGVWLSRQTGAPMMFSGGLGHAEADGSAESEADIAADIALREFLRPLRWVESKSRDTRENARYSVAMLRELGVTQVALVTHGWHMPRALRAFRDEAALTKVTLEIVPAPMGLSPPIERTSLRWVPSSEGSQLVRAALREKLATLFGA